MQDGDASQVILDQVQWTDETSTQLQDLIGSTATTICFNSTDSVCFNLSIIINESKTYSTLTIFSLVPRPSRFFNVTRRKRGDYDETSGSTYHSKLGGLFLRVTLKNWECLGMRLYYIIVAYQLLLEGMRMTSLFNLIAFTQWLSELNNSCRGMYSTRPV